MDYTALCARLQEIVENSFTAAQLALFFENAEQKIYNSIDLPAMKFSQNITTVDGAYTVAQPANLIYVYSLAVIFVNDYQYLLPKDESFIREAYPDPTVTGIPKFYAMVDDGTFILAPTPDDTYTMPITYAAYPESIVTAGNTWLGDNFDTVLLNGALVEAARFLKEDEDVIANYEKMYLHSIGLIKMTVDGKMKTDMYRSGLPRQRVA